jgi:pSer/pThr/pTyr-binding forkhead associated (FHA) protein
VPGSEDATSVSTRPSFGSPHPEAPQVGGKGEDATIVVGHEALPAQPAPAPATPSPPPWPPSQAAPPQPKPWPDVARAPAQPAEDAEATVVMKQPSKSIPLAWLAVISGPGAKPRTLFTLGAETVIGRTKGDFLLKGDPMVSGQHVKIRLEQKPGDGRQVFVLYDLASANGVYAGNKDNYRNDESRVYRHELADGDYLLLGDTTLVFKQVDS